MTKIDIIGTFQGVHSLGSGLLIGIMIFEVLFYIFYFRPSFCVRKLSNYIINYH